MLVNKMIVIEYNLSEKKHGYNKSIKIKGSGLLYPNPAAELQDQVNYQGQNSRVTPLPLFIDHEITQAGQWQWNL